MENFIKNNIDEHAGNGCDEHDGRALDELFVDDTLSGLDHDEDDHGPDDKDVGQCSYQLHSVISE